MGQGKTIASKDFNPVNDKDFNFNIAKYVGTANVIFYGDVANMNDLNLNEKYLVRIEQTYLLNDNLAE